MRFILTLLIGVALGIAAVWYFNHNKNNSQFATAGQEIKSTAQNAGNALSDKLHSWNLDRDHITNELAKTGRVIRDKANSAGQALKDATLDGRVTAAIKAKYVKDSDLSAWDIHVSTTDGVVTISGTVSSPELIGKAMTEALETDGARQVISTLQVKPKS
jgi:osmotically-inducible protein OsmY